VLAAVFTASPTAPERAIVRATAFLLEGLIAGEPVVARLDRHAVAAERHIFASHQIRAADMQLITGGNINAPPSSPPY
jgi:hypothetical protein